MEIILGLVVLLVIIGIPGYKVISTSLRHFLKNYIYRFLIFKPLDPRYRQAIKKYVDFYHLLSPEDQILFEKRVQRFILSKEFISRSPSLYITDEMKSLIASSAVQLTFGYPDVYFMHFYRILVYQDSYYSTITRKYHKGEVNARGLIVLSWSNLISGYIRTGDGRNLALHEMAHALLLEDKILNVEYNYIGYELIKAWEKLASIEIHRIQTVPNGFLRPYAATNSHELFAVSVEVFFEQPEELIKYSSAIYQMISAILKIDILVLKKTSSPVS